ncbi:MAG: alkaline phosphatase [Parahaliea sp.]
MLPRKTLFTALTLATVAAIPAAQARGPGAIPDHQANNPWFTSGAARVAEKKRLFPGASARRAKNVILFVGDGMGISTVTAGRIRDGQLKGASGEENNLSFDLMPYTGLSKTYNVNLQTPDSAGTATAMMSGVKTDGFVLGVDEDIDFGNCSTVAGNELVTALELAELAGKSTGVVTTTRVTHATPGSTYAKTASRLWEDISDMPQDAIDGGCTDIALQLVQFEQNLEARFPGTDVDGIEVVMGGGRRHFLPRDENANSPDAVSAIEGDRTDGRNLVTEWQAAYPDGDYVFDQSGFDALDFDSASNIFGLFNESDMRYSANRNEDISGEPSLPEMTAAALRVLKQNRKGFFLMVEGGRIDHGHHAGNASAALGEVVELSQAVQTAMDMLDMRETLIIVTADHSHTFTIAGYPQRGNPILGKVVTADEDSPTLAADGLPYTTLGYANGAGFYDLGDETDADAVYLLGPSETRRADISSIDTEAPGYHQEALVPMASETHGGEDVAIYGAGPGAHAVVGTNEQSVIFHIMNAAARLERDAARAVR